MSKATIILKLMLLALLALSPKAIAASSIDYLGSFHHERGTEEHVYIYRLDLWREGDKVFGFYSSSGGLQGDGKPETVPWLTTGTVKGQSLFLKNDHINFHFSGIMSKDKLRGRWSDSMETIELSLQRLPRAETPPALLEAPRESYKAWSQWAERYLDASDKNNPRLSQNADTCTQGDGSACLAAGNHSRLRGNQERARQRYETGCRLNNAICCINAGREDKAKEILRARCTGQSTMENNFACRTLGNLAEKSGNLREAREWYRKGCNDSIPKICPDLTRLEGR